MEGKHCEDCVFFDFEGTGWCHFEEMVVEATDMACNEIEEFEELNTGGMCDDGSDE